MAIYKIPSLKNEVTKTYPAKKNLEGFLLSLVFLQLAVLKG